MRITKVFTKYDALFYYMYVSVIKLHPILIERGLHGVVFITFSDEPIDLHWKGF